MAFANELDHLIAVAEGGAHGPRVPSCRACNARRGQEVQQRLAERRGKAKAAAPFLPRWAPPGSRPYVGAIEVESARRRVVGENRFLTTRVPP